MEMGSVGYETKEAGGVAVGQGRSRLPPGALRQMGQEASHIQTWRHA